MPKAWKVKIEGSFFYSNKEAQEDYEVEGIIPHCEKAWVLSFVKARLLKKWIKEKSKKTPLSVVTYEMIKCEEVDHDFKLEGKDIGTLSWEELQSFAVEFTILSIPLVRNGKLSDARSKAKEHYLKEIKQKDLTGYTKNIVGKIGDKNIYDFSEIPVIIHIDEKITAPSKDNRDLAADLKAEEAERAGKSNLGSEGKKTDAPKTTVMQ